MKNIFFLLLFLLISSTIFAQLEGGEGPNPEYMLEQDQTNANLPLPSEILVVYNANIENAETVANYYQQVRNIPSINICPLSDLPLSVNYGQEGGAYLVNFNDDGSNYLAEDGEVIVSWVPPPGSTGKAHWLYYKDYIETPIKNYMEENNLTEDIRYVVLIKGLPYRLSPSANYSRKGASVCALLSLMNQLDERDILTLYNTSYNHTLGYYTNPYLGVDYPPTMNYRFKSQHFVNSGGWYLNYLVSRLDGDTYDDVIDLIDRISVTDKSGGKKWILDDKPISLNPPVMKYSTMPLAATRLLELGFNYRYDDLVANITSDNDNVIGYSSHGYYAFWDSSYIWSQLQFNYANGAIFNTWESGNALSYGKWHSHFGHLSDFVIMNGSGGGGNVNEPLIWGIFREGDSYPAYAMGYSIVDAIYQGINYIAWQNDVIGDPLQTIAWGKQSLTSNLNWSGTNLVTGEINISDLKTLTVANNSIINLRHQGFITGEGKLILGQNVTFNLYSWQKGLFLSYDSDNPRLVWGAHPTLGSGANYRVYRKFGVNGSWVLIATTSAKEYKDLQMQFSVIGDEADNLFYKVIAFSELPGTYESNIVACTGNKAPKKIKANQNLNSPVEYSLEQNYPNPFNPTTQINYSIKEAGLVQLKVYDILGKEIATLVNENKETGNYIIDFNAAELPSGVYIYQLTTPGFTLARKMILAK
ncbi:MAG TPA: T9SS type A sorting domain-containing protein [Ignavibacteriaceae bacterium]|nr:T9SS type A sorting domain-containing protein [Ignavibacteriaceae bacterium]HRP91816.1 T9SS type A sorting domain-containing protein [Ignavibacteriaceae bacterium]HRQ53935.1 T9SS type A sorting domain-containing protein [Ignavibacteriaceae bacterium]